MEARVDLICSGDRTRTSCTHERTCVGSWWYPRVLLSILGIWYNSLLNTATHSAAAEAEAAAQRTEIKCAEIAQTQNVLTVSIRGNGPHQCLEFISDLGHRISRVTDDSRETLFLFQCISVAIKRSNANISSNSFCHADDNTASLPKHTSRV